MDKLVTRMRGIPGTMPAGGRLWFSPLVLALLMTMVPFAASSQIQKHLRWDSLAATPTHIAASGMFAGVSGDALICMGGRRPGNRITGDDTAHYSDAIYILEDAAGTWRKASSKLPRPAAGGVSCRYRDEIIIAGGQNGDGCLSNVDAVSFRKGRIWVDSLPSLPFGLSDMAGAVVDNTLFIVGGKKGLDGRPTRTFLALDLASDSSGWIHLQSWPGPPRVLASCASAGGCLYLFGGRGADSRDSAAFRSLKDCYKFRPAYRNGRLTGGTWSLLASLPWDVLAAPQSASTLADDYLFFPAWEARVVQTDQGPLVADTLFSLSSYHISTNQWLSFGSLPLSPSQEQFSLIDWGNHYVALDVSRAGSIQPISISRKLGFGWINWLSLIVYLLFMVWLGIFYDKRGQTADNFFTAGGKIPWWASGCSIYGSQLSAITFMAIPAIVFATDWSLAIGSFLILATVPIVSRYYVPFFRRLNVTSAYEYLEHRFDSAVRLMGCLAFILFQMGRMGIVLFLPAAAIASVTGIDIYVLIVIMGAICIAYTVLGGIEAVVWTDVAQVIILMGGAILCLGIAIGNIPGGLHTVFQLGMRQHKFTLFHLNWRPDNLNLWVCVVGFFFLNIIPYTSDQTVIQKYLTVKDEKQTVKSLWFNAIVTMPATFIFFGLGTVLFIFYQINPAVLPSREVGNVLPYFVVQQLPVGIAGLVIAGIFAASQSTLSSSMNSIAATFYSDIYRRIKPNIDSGQALSIARKTTILSGLFGTLSALVIALLHIQFIFDLFSEVLGIVGGSLAGVFILGIFTERSSARGAIAGTVIGVLITLAVIFFTDISVYLYGAVSVIGCVTGGYLFSLLMPSSKDTRGMTYATLRLLKGKGSELSKATIN